MRFLSPNGSPIVGTKELIPGMAYASEYSETGEPEYEGETDVYWNDQKTIKRRGPNGKVSLVYLDEGGEEWTFDQLSPEPDDADDEEYRGQGEDEDRP